MDFDTACQFLVQQTVAPKEAQAEDTFLARLKQGQPPIPGQVTSMLLALKAVYDGLHHEPMLSRELVQALFSLSYESRQLFDHGQRQGVEWPPLLDDDLKRIAIAVKSILADQGPA